MSFKKYYSMTEKLNPAAQSQRTKNTLQEYWRISKPNL